MSRQSADEFARKVAIVQSQSTAAEGIGRRRTPFTQDELNSWFAFRAEPLLPMGLTQPQVTIVGQGQLAGQAILDLDVVAKRRSGGGGSFDPLSFLAGRVPVSVTGVLHTADGKGRIEVQSAQISGVPVPASLLEELVGYYSRSPERPDGLSLGDMFQLPANIRQIEIGKGQAVIIQ